jgi:glycosyltransferase involved in cell wall biosynthesis
VGPAPPSRGGIAHAVGAIAASERLASGYRFVVVPTHAHGGPLRKAARVAAAFARLAWLLAARRVDVVHVHSASGSSFWRKAAATLLARTARVPVLFHVHGGAFHRQLARPGLRRLAVRAVLSRADGVAVLTEGWARELASRLPARELHVVPNCVAAAASAAAVASEPGLIVFLGDLRPEKGVFELVEALAIVRGRGVDAHAVLAGEGPARSALAARAQALQLPPEAVRLPGWIDAPARDALLARAACFCLPSYEEGLPLALLEAMAAGTAIVATAVGGIPEAARAELEALLVPPRDAARLAGALERVLRDDRLRRSLAARARARAVAYGEEAMAERLDALYRELASRGRRRAALGKVRHA